MMKKLYPLLTAVGSDLEKEYFKYLRTHKIHFTKGHKHKMELNGELWVIRHISIEMTEEENEAFDKEFNLVTL